LTSIQLALAPLGGDVFDTSKTPTPVLSQDPVPVYKLSLAD
jgi:hypothetical protein